MGCIAIPAERGLIRIPIAEGNDGEDEYDALDMLTGMAYENAVAKLSNEERRIYASRA